MGLSVSKDPIKKIAGRYNMVTNVFWSVLNLFPVSIFCYDLMEVQLLYIFSGAAILTVFLPKSFFDGMQLASRTNVYKRMGVHLINKFTQNGILINRMIRKKFPYYKVIHKRKLSIIRLLRQTYVFEKFHFAMFVFFSLTTIYALLDGHLVWAFIITLTNVVYNVYPNFLQQYIRLRLTSVAGMA